MARLPNLGVEPRQLAYAVHFLGVASLTLALTWSLHFRGGVAWRSHTKSRIFNLHPPLMVAFLFLAGEATLVFRTLPAIASGGGGSDAKQVRKLVHLSLHLPALLLGVLGICAAFRYHSGTAHLFSLHSWLGIASLALLVVHWALAFLGFWAPGLPPRARARALPWHVAAGLGAWAMADAAAVTGVMEKLTFMQAAGVLARSAPESIMANFLGLILFLMGVALLLAVAVPRHAGGAGAGDQGPGCGGAHAYESGQRPSDDAESCRVVSPAGTKDNLGLVL